MIEKHGCPRKNSAPGEKEDFPLRFLYKTKLPFSPCSFSLFLLPWGKRKKGGRRMEKQIPFQKLSKKKQREENRKHRNTWGPLNPVTRRPENPKAYNRRKAQKRMDDPRFCAFSFWEKRPIAFPLSPC